MPLFILLAVVPIIEIALFIQVGGAIGLWPTLATVIATALAARAAARCCACRKACRGAGIPRGPSPTGR